ncbi:MAG: hypothetical protein IMZ44_06565 [Planctomycetes bacterium]|nr:hypothetical protein [Planctomycetota bacterium]
MRWTWMLWIAVAAVLVVAPVALAADHGAKGGAKGTFGEIKSVDIKNGTGTITIAVRGKEKGATEDKILGITTATKVKVEAAPAAEGEKPQAKEGTAADLVVGKRVMVKCSEDGKTALEIIVTAPHERKGGKK